MRDRSEKSPWRRRRRLLVVLVAVAVAREALFRRDATRNPLERSWDDTR